MDFIEEFETSIKLWGGGDIIDAISNRPSEDVFEFAETMALISRYHFKSDNKKNENFSFIANSSLSGGTHPCSHPACRQNRLKQLSSFASLYADEVYIQDPFESIILSEPQEIREIERQELMAGICNYLYLKPLIEKGIVKYAHNMISLCEHHNEKLAKPLSQQIEKKENKLYELIHEYLIDKCSIVLNGNENTGLFLEVSGPEDFIDHGKTFLHLYDPIPKHIRSCLKKKLPYNLSKKEIINENILSIIITPILRDLSKQEWHSAFNGTSYLCDNKTQIRIASQINNKAYVANSSAFENGMQHLLPAIYSDDSKYIVDLREKEPEAFAVYRDKLNSMIHEAKSWNEQEVTAIFRDQVLPEINLIEKKIKDWKSNIRETFKEKVIFGTGAVTVGLYAGLLPPNIGQIIAAVGGGSAIATALMDYNKTSKEKQEARKNDFYFLWQAKQ